MRVYLFAAAAFLTLGQASAQSPFGPLSEPSSRPFAAAPHRELARRWIQCIDTAAQFIITQQQDTRLIQRFVLPGCSEEESLLTGSLVRQFGYERGNRAVAVARSELLENYDRQIAALRQQQRLQQGNQTQSGWGLRQLIPGTCLAYVEGRTPTLQGVGTGIYLVGSEARIVFTRQDRAAQSIVRTLRHGQSLSINLAVFRNFEGRQIGQFAATIHKQPTEVGFTFVLTRELQQQLRGADSVQFRLSVIGEPLTFPIRDVPDAITALSTCRRT